MKLLFDQNLSPHLVARWADLYPRSAHVVEQGLDRSQGIDVWQHAAAAGFLIVTKDADFSELSTVRGFPPKVIWIRRGNCSTDDIESLLRGSLNLVRDLGGNDAAGILLLH